MSATENNRPAAPTRDAVAWFDGKDGLRQAVGLLLKAGFAPADLSVLGGQDSLEVAGTMPGYEAKPSQSLLAGLVDEAPMLMPFTIAGVTFLSGGPVAAAIGGLVALGLGLASLDELGERLVANRHVLDFAKAIRAGALGLWVRTDGAESERHALEALNAAGGRDAHIHARSAG